MKPSERSLEGVMAELKALRQAYGAAQRRCTATVQRLHARNQLLEAEVLQLRAQLAAREPSMAMAGEEQRRMLGVAGAAPADAASRHFGLIVGRGMACGIARGCSGNRNVNAAAGAAVTSDR